MTEYDKTIEWGKNNKFLVWAFLILGAGVLLFANLDGISNLISKMKGDDNENNTPSIQTENGDIYNTEINTDSIGEVHIGPKNEISE